MANFTKSAITDSFLKLLNQKKFDKITIKDIVSDCGISRKTFYYYFDDIYDLLQKYLAELTHESIISIDNPHSFESELIKLMEFEKTYTVPKMIKDSAEKFAEINKNKSY